MFHRACCCGPDDPFYVYDITRDVIYKIIGDAVVWSVDLFSETAMSSGPVRPYLDHNTHGLYAYARDGTGTSADFYVIKISEADGSIVATLVETCQAISGGIPAVPGFCADDTWCYTLGYNPNKANVRRIYPEDLTLESSNPTTFDFTLYLSIANLIVLPCATMTPSGIIHTGYATIETATWTSTNVPEPYSGSPGPGIIWGGDWIIKQQLTSAHASPGPPAGVRLVSSLGTYNVQGALWMMCARGDDNLWLGSGGLKFSDMYFFGANSAYQTIAVEPLLTKPGGTTVTTPSCVRLGPAGEIRIVGVFEDTSGDVIPWFAEFSLSGTTLTLLRQVNLEASFLAGGDLYESVSAMTGGGRHATF